MRRHLAVKGNCKTTRFVVDTQRRKLILFFTKPIRGLQAEAQKHLIGKALAA